MKIRDRGIVKWLPASFMTEQRSMMQEMWKDECKFTKPILDEYQEAEIESKIHYSMEYNLKLTASIWFDGYTEKETFRAHYIDSIHKRVRGKDEHNNNITIDFTNIVAIDVIED